METHIQLLQHQHLFKRANFRLARVYKHRKNSQYSTYKSNYPYWKGYPYDKNGFNICKLENKVVGFLPKSEWVENILDEFKIKAN